MSTQLSDQTPVCLPPLVMQERAFRHSSAVDTRTPWLTRKPTDMAAVARTPITTDLLACLTNTKHPPLTSGGCAMRPEDRPWGSSKLGTLKMLLG